MGKSMCDFGNQAKEKARQQKQIDKASRRIMAKQQMFLPVLHKQSTLRKMQDFNPLSMIFPQQPETDLLNAITRSTS